MKDTTWEKKSAWYEWLNSSLLLLLQENVLIEFRGDCFHGVSGFISATTEEPRISLVLEQFRIPTEMYNVTWEWRKGTYMSRFPMDTIRENPSYYVLDDAQRQHTRNLLQDESWFYFRTAMKVLLMRCIIGIPIWYPSYLIHVNVLESRGLLPCRDTYTFWRKYIHVYSAGISV